VASEDGGAALPMMSCRMGSLRDAYTLTWKVPAIGVLPLVGTVSL
jgi:hypothetical protein